MLSNSLSKDILGHPYFKSTDASSRLLQDKLKNSRCKQFLKSELDLTEDARLGINLGCTTRWSSSLVQYQKQLQWKPDLEAMLVCSIDYHILTLRIIMMQQSTFLKT
jgi:hypothetical protein